MKYVSEQEYLSNPAFKHSEWVNGQVTDLNVGTKKHGITAAHCGALLERMSKLCRTLTSPRSFIAGWWSAVGPSTGFPTLP